METSSAQRCWQDSDCVNEAVAAFNLCFPGSKDNRELFGSNHSHLRQTLLDCIQDKGNLNGHNLKYLELLSSILDTPRRSLATRPGPSPSPSPARPPKRSRAPPTRSRRSPSPRKSFFPPSKSPSPPPAKKNVSKNSTTAPVSPAKRKEDHQKTIIIAVVVTAVSTFLFAALFFLCCTRVCGNRSGGKKNDERPLLSLSSSDYSVGISPLSHGTILTKNFLSIYRSKHCLTFSGSSINYGGSVKGEKMGHHSFNIYSNQGKMSSFDGSNSDNSDSLEERPSHELNSSITNHGFPPLKPPPGRTASVLSGKSFSGKVEPLPPEPPKFLKVSSKKASAPPPAAPAPPMPSSAGPPRPPPPAPPPGSGGPKPPPPPGLKGPRPPPPMSLGPKAPRSSSGTAKESDDDAPKTKLKPFFWDKVQANPEHSMVWNDIRSGSFQ